MLTLVLILWIPLLAGWLTWELARRRPLTPWHRRRIVAFAATVAAILSVVSFYAAFYLFGLFRLQHGDLYLADRCFCGNPLRFVDEAFDGHRTRLLEYRGHQDILEFHREGRVRVFGSLEAVAARVSAVSCDSTEEITLRVVDSFRDEWVTVEFVYHSEAFD